MTRTSPTVEAPVDPITLELYRHRFAGVAEEMGVTLRRTGYSPNIKERLDFSCAVFDHRGRLIAQAAHIPAHLGAMPASVATILSRFHDWARGDVVIVNDPFAGGNHLPDITMVSPVFAEDAATLPDFFVASRAHHADVGGMSPGSLPLSTEIYQEGIIIPPVKLYKAGRLDADLLRLILRNVRTPDERRGDLAAQRAAAAVGERRLTELVATFGREQVLAYAGHLLSYSERITRAAIRDWPDGDYRAEDVLELVEGERVTLVPLRVCVTIAGDQVTFDFSGTAPVMRGSLNAVIAITQSACYYAVRCLVGEVAPMNDGCFAPVQVIAPPGCVVNAGNPAAVAGGNVETAQRITDLVLAALAQALPEHVPAASQGTMNNLTIGGWDLERNQPYAYYETIGGGMGARPTKDGVSAIHTHMTNTMNTPVEALEYAYPMRVGRYEIRRGSGGAGRYRGGDGIRRDIEMLNGAQVTILSDRRKYPPYGLAGGELGRTGRNLLIRGGEVWELPGKVSLEVEAGDVVSLRTPGGGGYGTAQDAG